MQFKKMLSGMLAFCTAATAARSAMPVLPAFADDNTLLFSIRTSEGEDQYTVFKQNGVDLAYTIPFQVSIPVNPGMNAANLKFQINDGEIREDGSFGNYGFGLMKLDFASPYCFDSANNGDAAGSFQHLANPEKWNITWVNSQDLSVNADSAAQSDTYAWDRPEWSTAFLTGELLVAESVLPGEYTLTIRTEDYENALGGKKTRSSCLGITPDSVDAVEIPFAAEPLVIHIDEPVSTTATTITSTETSETATTTTTSVTGGETQTTVSETTVTTPDTTGTTNTTESTTRAADAWTDDYAIADAGHYLIIGDVAGKPGQTVTVPIYVYGDPGTAGIEASFSLDPALKLKYFAQTPDRDNIAYLVDPTYNLDKTYPSIAMAQMETLYAKDGSVFTNMKITIPKDAAPGKVYDINFIHNGEDCRCSAVDRNGQDIKTDFYNGSITVLAEDGAPCLNRTSVYLKNKGDTVNLTMFNTNGPVTWSSADETLATVDRNGFVKAVASEGSVEITAEYAGRKYTCFVKIGGLFGNVDGKGEVDIIDVVYTLEHISLTLMGVEPELTPDQIQTADVDGDGDVDIFDASYILEYINLMSLGVDVTWYEITGNPNAPGAP